LSDSSFSNFLRTVPSDDIQANLMANLMADQFQWTCANVLIGLDDPYSTTGAQAFEIAAKTNNIKVCTKAQYVSGSGDMRAAISDIMDKQCCKVNVVFGQARDLASLFLEAHEQRYDGEWVVGDNVLNSVDAIMDDLKHELSPASIHKLLQGIFSITAKPLKSSKYDDFERAWYTQPSSAAMSPNGTRTNCSDAVDATGRYIWRENGEKDGRCCGIDFEQAGEKWRAAATCSHDDPVCASAAISTYVPFAYDATIALAHGLDKLLNDGYDVNNISAKALFEATQQSTFEGVSGQVSFRKNGDRRWQSIECVVYNYHAGTRKFEAVGEIVDSDGSGRFVPCQDDDCPSIFFSDGSTKKPHVKIERAPSPYFFGLIATGIAIGSVAVILLIAKLLYRRFKALKKKNEKERADRELKARLDENWSTLLQSECVGSLSEMPEQWKSGIVPKYSDTGKKLDKELQRMAEQIKQNSTRCTCRGTRADGLHDTLYKFLERDVAPFFAERDQMYTDYLLKHPSLKFKKSESKSGKALLRRSRTMLIKDLNWPENTTPLFQQVMYLQRDLDDMFKNSYNQRFMLRVMNANMATWNDWAMNDLPALRLAKSEDLKQNTSDLFELYSQAVDMKSYYDSVLKHIAKQAGAEWHPSPLKKIFRILEKAGRVKQSNDDSVYFDCSRIFDIVRGTLICDSLGDMQGGVLCAVRTLIESKKFNVVRVKDRFNKPTHAGWRDVLINGRMVSPKHNFQSLILEVQIHEKELRDERKTVGGHYMYERHRALFEACGVACGSEVVERMLEDLHIPLAPERNHERLQRTFAKSVSSMIMRENSGVESGDTPQMETKREIELPPLPPNSLQSTRNQVSVDIIDDDRGSRRNSSKIQRKAQIHPSM